jgi:hypothetical protein
MFHVKRRSKKGLKFRGSAEANVREPKPGDHAPPTELAPNTSERRLQDISNSELSVPAHDSFSTRKVRTSREDRVLVATWTT